MTAKEYLLRAYRIDQRINSKIEQLTMLRGLSKIMARAAGGRQTEGIAEKMAELEAGINEDIETLVDFKQETANAIKKISDAGQQTLLELRYLCYKPWERIAEEMNYSVDNVFRMHRRALESVAAVLTLQQNQL